MKDVMIDIETLGTAPGSVVLSIGAVQFNAYSGEMGEEFYVAIDPADSVACGASMDISTIKWWMDQSSEAKDAAFSGVVYLRPALDLFSSYIRRCAPDRVWAKPPSFDHVLTESAFRMVGLDIPWHYKTPRDCRTLFEISGAVQPDVGTAHNALDDAKSQALGVIDGYARLGLTA